MKKLVLLAAITGLLAVATYKANANTISVGAATTASVAGGVDWIYPLTFNNTSVVGAGGTGANGTIQSFININDFGTGTFVSLTGLPGAVTYTYDNSQVEGPNTGGTPGPPTDSNSILDAVIKFTNASAVSIPDGSGTLTLFTTLTMVGGPAQWTTSDVQTGGVAPGFPSAGQGFVRTPAAPQVPDGGVTAMLLGAALSGLGLIRRKLS
jgi:VPDSG-CTERM motif